ncbi:MAG: hypothetical protein JWM78_1766 [Verrucomicrobiaceae bacterium]|nr:hypothetical protein [Verrucomicrobiaceae bacterium]
MKLWYIYTWNGASGVVLTWASLTTAQQNALVDTAAGESTFVNAQKRLLWLAGDQTNEDGVLLRKRTTLLGDIVNSDPVYAGAEDRGYTSLPASVPGQNTYAAYVASKKTRTPIIAVGANDGMLHIFKSSDGTELFAFMPSTAIMKAIALTRPSYGATINPHQYFVNGSMYVDDVYISGAWRTYLFGAMGSGGQAVFALDISNPDSMTASNIKFEMTNVDNSHVGYVLGQPQIAFLADGTWSAVFGNGYNSGDDRAYLMVVDLSNKSNTTTVATNSGSSNGLAGPELLMRADGTIATAYAGDLLGNLWKFDLSSTNRSDWAIAYGQPLFIARSSSGAVQPITSTPNLGFNFQNGNKVMVYFGTGQYFATGDNIVTGTTVQSFYGIEDVGPITSTDRSQLWPKTWGLDSQNRRAVIETQVDWSVKKGWYLDFDTTLGERVITSALLAYDQLIFPTFIPSQNACSFGGSGELVDTSGVNGTSFVPIIGQSVVQLAVAVIKTPAYIESGSKIYFPSSNLQGNSGGLPTGTPPPVAGQKGRVSWRQLK